MPQSPVISVSGRFAAPEGEKFSVQASGSGHLGNFLFLETPYEELGADFSWNDGDLYLRDLVVKHDHGQLEGDVLSRGNTIKYDLTSTLPLSAFDPFITSGSKTELELAKVKFRDNSTLNLDIEGELDHSDLTTWTSSGKAHLSNFTYRDTDLHHLKTEFEIKQGQQSFTMVKCLVNDNKEIARTRFGGKPSKELNVDSILIDRNAHQVVISNLRGELWPTPIIRIFAPAASRHLENNYRFHEPPNVTLNGSFSTKKGDNTKNAYSVRITTKGQTDYPFLGKPLPTTNLKADVTIKRSQVTVDNIFFNTLDGTAAGKVIIDTKRGGPNSYRGTMKWNRLYFPKISQVYQFKEKEKGWLTGQINFSGVDSDIRQFNATGVIGIEKGNLVSLPVLGPLSPIIAGVLGDKRMGYERAKDASATFAIQNGVWQTKDFSAVSTSINLTGEGWIDMKTERMDMTVRLNARGLLGFLTMPLAPLKGMFQFRGTGEFSNPKWKPSPFTRPAKGAADPIFRTPGRAQVVPE